MSELSEEKTTRYSFVGYKRALFENGRQAVL